jgi:hypothetical protein
MAAGEELAIEFFPPGDSQGLADCIVQLLENPEKQQAMAAQNFSAALRMTMPNVVQKYLRHFEVQQRVQTLRYVSRFRRLPQWVPSKSLLLRFMTRNSLSWARRSAVLYTGWNGLPDPRLLHSDGDGRGKQNGPGSAADGNGIALRSRTGGVDCADGFSSTSNGNGKQDGQSAGPHNGHEALALNFADSNHSQEAETEQPGSEKELPSFASIRGQGSRSNGQNGSGDARTRGDGGRGERTA